MKILYVFCSQNFSGAEIVIERLILANRNKVTPTVLCPPGEFAERLKNNGVEVREETSLSSLERARNVYSKFQLFVILLKKFFRITRVANNLLKQGYLAVHANNLSAAFYLIPILFLNKIKRNTKWIWSNHDLTYPNGIRSERLAGLCHKHYDLTLAVSEAVKAKYKTYQTKIKILYNGLDANRFLYKKEERIKFRHLYNIPEESVVIGIVGLISERKGQHLLMAVYENLLKDFPNLILFIIGKFSTVEIAYETMIRKQIKNHQKGRVILSDPRPDIENVYPGLDIVVNATNSQMSEPLGTTIYEAMSCERIVVASNTGGTPEIITNNQEGFLFEPNNQEDFYNKLKFVITNIRSLTSIRINAREKAVNFFSLNKMVQAYNNILLSLNN